ncbi:hypothetical protein BCR43DRAFT_519561 [Syncephalastrum racemosum]|uniref:Uncharacterized protein n=1 Tax=Syncephalastrum racemosum TaxID=13706 RepID=A0A1X2HRM7_SYNRA|nr:hypothetical protein BCR43DRAFT_519561 [Syncephalastrum racemosum]
MRKVAPPSALELEKLCQENAKENGEAAKIEEPHQAHQLSVQNHDALSRGQEKRNVNNVAENRNPPVTSRNLAYREQYFCREPTSVTFCVDHVQPRAILGQFTKEDDGKPYLLSYQAADLWAKQCILIPKQVDLSFLTDDVQLDPVLALSLFFTEKQSCVARHTYAQDSTIRSLYMLAKRFVESERHIQENYIRTLNNICTTNEHQLMKMHDELDVLAPNISKLRKLVNRSIDYNRKLQQRYPINDHDDNSGSEIELPPQVSLTGPSTPSVPSDGSDGKLDDFMFITAFKQNYVKTMGRMDWRACFQAGRNENRFARYSTSASLRTQYDKYQAAQKRKSKRN